MSVRTCLLPQTAPSLLWADDVGACAKQTIALLRKWGPRSDVTVILETYPEMIIRIPKYYANTEFFELPVRSFAVRAAEQ